MKKPHANPIQSWWQELLVNEAIDAYVDWRHECRAVRDAYRRWTSASAADAGLAFEGYLAALRREERAAEVYRDQLTVVEHVFETKVDGSAGRTQATFQARRQEPRGATRGLR